MLSKINLVALTLTASCATTGVFAEPSGDRKIDIYGAYLFFSPHGGVIDDLDCPWNALPVDLDGRLYETESGRRFLKIKNGGGKLGPLPKYLVVDATVLSKGPLNADIPVRLLRVRSIREVADNFTRLQNMASTKGCEKDLVHRRAWLSSLQRKR